MWCLARMQVSLGKIRHCFVTKWYCRNTTRLKTIYRRHVIRNSYLHSSCECEMQLKTNQTVYAYVIITCAYVTRTRVAWQGGWGHDLDLLPERTPSSEQGAKKKKPHERCLIRLFLQAQYLSKILLAANMKPLLGCGANLAFYVGRSAPRVIRLE